MFCLIYFYSCKKSGGAKAPPAPPSARSLLLWDIPTKSLSQAEYRGFNFAIFQLLQEVICTTKSFY